jgi:hypothetical protein
MAVSHANGSAMHRRSGGRRQFFRETQKEVTEPPALDAGCVQGDCVTARASCRGNSQHANTATLCWD